MFVADAALFAKGSSRLAGVRTTLALRWDELYVKSGKLWVLLFSRSANRILFSEKPDWEKTIRIAFRRLPHQIDFGPITADSYQSYDIVVPLTLAGLEAAQQHSDPQKRALPLPSAETVRLCDDKLAFNKAMIAAGFSKYIPTITQGLGLTPPYILKKRIGIWGKNCFVIRNLDDENAHLGRIHDADYFCQDLVLGGTEYATHILFENGKIVKALNIRYEFDTDAAIKGQNAPAIRVVCRSRYLSLWTQMLRAIKYEGLCCVNYKEANGQPYLLEINPRFGGSLGPYFFSFIRHLHA